MKIIKVEVCVRDIPLDVCFHATSYEKAFNQVMKHCKKLGIAVGNTISNNEGNKVEIVLEKSKTVLCLNYTEIDVAE